MHAYGLGLRLLLLGSIYPRNEFLLLWIVRLFGIFCFHNFFGYDTSGAWEDTCYISTFIYIFYILFGYLGAVALVSVYYGNFYHFLKVALTPLFPRQICSR